MSTDYPSSNPFRRKAPASTTPSASAEHPSILSHIASQHTILQTNPDSTYTSNIDAPKKAIKKVRVQSPPPPSPSIPDSVSTIGVENFSISAKPPTPIPRDENDPFDSATDSISEGETASRPTQAQAPPNPFQKTLQTLENPGREGPVIPPTNIASPGRASMDVDAFKRLLMTGNAGLGISTPPAASQAPAHHGLGDGGSSTDTSSLSRQSMFEPIQEVQSETPRTSHEISEPDDDRRGLTAEVSTAGRKKPPPPSSRHGKLIKVELRDDPSSTIALASPPSSSSSNQFFSSSPSTRSQTDLNKPLPPAPARASHDSEDRESIFDKESAGKTPEPPSPSASLRRKTPPAPPLTRRHSQLVSDSKLTNRSDTGRLSPKVEEDSASVVSSIDIGRSNSTRAPPPPPSRRPASIKGSSLQAPLTSPSATSLPPVPPARGSSRSISGGRPPSISSMDMSSPPPTASSTPKRSSMLPPPPPPPRGHRSSIEDESRRTSVEHGRRSTDSVRRESGTSSINQLERVESPEGTKGAQDILAEMSKLQADIDALRLSSEKEQEA